MKLLRQYWGLIALVLLLTMWWTAKTGPAPLLILSGLVVLWSTKTTLESI